MILSTSNPRNEGRSNKKSVTANVSSISHLALKFRILNQQLWNYKNIPTPKKTIIIYSLLTFSLLFLGSLFLGMALSLNTVGPLEYVNDDGDW